MTCIKIVICSTVLCALISVSAAALEATSNNAVGVLRDGLSNRLEVTTAIYKASFDTMNVRVNATENDLTLIKSKGANNEVDLWNPRLETRLDSIESSLTSQNNYINSIMTNGKNNEVNKWNPEMEARFDAIEASLNNHETRIDTLEGKGAAKLAFKKEVVITEGKTSAALNYDLCMISYVGLSTTADNHAHACDLSMTGASSWTLKATSTGARTTCNLMCFNID